MTADTIPATEEATEAVALMDQAVARALDAVPAPMVAGADAESRGPRHVCRVVAPVEELGWRSIDVWEPQRGSAPVNADLARLEAAATSVRVLGRVGLLQVMEWSILHPGRTTGPRMAHRRHIEACPGLRQLLIVARCLESRHVETLSRESPGRLYSGLVGEGWIVRLAPFGVEL